MPAAATQFRLFPFARKVYSDFTVWNFDRAFVIEITDENPNPDFFDGNTPDTAAITYAWTGTANNSTSTATWTAPALAVVDGAVRGTVYGRATASIRRTGTIDMSELPYLRITGTATAAADGQVSVADDGSVPISPLSYSYNGATGAYEIVVKRPEGFTNLGVTFTRNSGAVSTTGGIFVAVDSIEITDAPFGTGRVQTRQVPVYGSQRTEVSIDVRGLDTDGTTPVGLGAQVLVCTSAAGDDGRAKSLAVRAASTVSVSPTSDSAATSGSYNPLATIASGNYPTFELDSSALLPGTFDVYASIYAVTAATHTVSLRADLDHGLDAVRVGDWQDTIVTAVSSGAVWPQILEDVYRLMPVGEVTVGEDGGILSLSLASASTTNMRVDDLFLLHRTASQVSLINTASSSGSLSRVRLDAATVTRPRPSAWVGQVGGAMMDAALAGRCQAFAQHQAEPGLLQFFTVTPGCSTSRVSATYYERFAHDAASILAGAA